MASGRGMAVASLRVSIPDKWVGGAVQWNAEENVTEFCCLQSQNLALVATASAVYSDRGALHFHRLFAL